jgi:hypothetical protein
MMSDAIQQIANKTKVENALPSVMSKKDLL